MVGRKMYLLTILGCLCVFMVTEVSGTRRFLLDTFPRSECRNSVADIEILLDSSNDISPQDFEAEKLFAKDFAKHAYIGHNHYQVAVATYSSKYRPEIDFHKGSNRETLLKEISNLRYKPGDRNIMQALNGTIQIMVRPQSGERLYAAKITILVTAGSAHNAANAYLTAALKVFNVTIFVVAVTPKAKTVDNRALVVDDKHIFYLDDFSGLSSLPDMMLTTLCHDVILGSRCYDMIPTCSLIPCTNYSRETVCPKYCGVCSASSGHIGIQSSSTTHRTQSVHIPTKSSTKFHSKPDTTTTPPELHTKTSSTGTSEQSTKVSTSSLEWITIH